MLNYLKTVVPSLAREFEGAFTVRGTLIQWEEVIAAFVMKKENLLKADIKENLSCRDLRDCFAENLVEGLVFNFLKEMAPGLAEDFEEAFSFCHTQLQLKDVLEQFRKHTGGSLTGAESRTAKGLKPSGKKSNKKLLVC